MAFITELSAPRSPLLNARHAEIPPPARPRLKRNTCEGLRAEPAYLGNNFRKATTAVMEAPILVARLTLQWASVTLQKTAATLLAIPVIAIGSAVGALVGCVSPCGAISGARAGLRHADLTLAAACNVLVGQPFQILEAVLALLQQGVGAVGWAAGVVLTSPLMLAGRVPRNNDAAHFTFFKPDLAFVSPFTDL